MIYDQLRGNQDVFLGCILNDPDFERIKRDILGPDPDLSIEIFRITACDYCSNIGKSIKSCIEAIAIHFRIKDSTAKKLIFTRKRFTDFSFGYIPTIYIEDDQVHIIIGPKTTLKDIRICWPLVKDKQKEIGKTRNRKSTNPELAYCIHKQIMSGKKLKQAFDLYINGKLEDYNHSPTLLEFNDFRKYYNEIVKGL